MTKGWKRAPRPPTVGVGRRQRGYVVDVSVPTPTGRERHRQAFGTRAQANAHANAIRARLRAGLPAFERPEEARHAVTVLDVLKFYEERHVSVVVSTSSRERLVQHREAIEKCALAAVEAETATLADLERFKGERKVSASTVSKDFRHIKAAMLFAKARGFISRHVFESLDRDTRRSLMPSWSPEQTAGRVLSDDEFEKVLVVMRPAARRIARFLRATGLRKMEACALDWREHWQDLPYPAFCPITQKKSKERLIPFEAVEGIVGPRQKSGLVFQELGETRKAIYSQLTTCWRYAAHKAGVVARLHDLRHTFGSTLRRTMSKEDVASIMGISGAIASTYLDHESADLTRRAFAKPGTNAAQKDSEAVSESNRK